MTLPTPDRQGSTATTDDEAQWVPSGRHITSVLSGSRLLEMVRSKPYALTAGVFIAAALSRDVWLSHAQFHPDESSVLWMALDAIRHHTLPDHGLISSYSAFQPPGLVWMTLPFVALGGGRPEFVIAAFGLLNAGALAFLIATVAREWGLKVAALISPLLIVGPDASMSSWVWHPSLYTAAIATLIAAGLRLRSGSRWWAVVVIAIPGLYGLIHYSGFVLVGSSLLLLLLSRRKIGDLWVPLVIGIALTLMAWTPFLSFEAQRHWSDFTTISNNADAGSTFSLNIHQRYGATKFALRHLGRGFYGAVLLTPVVVWLAFAAFIVSAVRRKLAAPVLVPSAVLAGGVAVQIVTNMAARTDVLMLWLVPLYMLAGWTLSQIRWTTPAILAVVGVMVLGSIDLDRAVRKTPAPHTLSHEWEAARSKAPVHYEPAAPSTLYLPCDPPWYWGAETWYLEEVLHPGDGIKAAVAANAFAGRKGQCAAHQQSPNAAGLSAF